VHEPLRRDVTLGLEIFLAVVVPDPQPQPLQERRGNRAEMLGLRFAPPGLENPYSLLDFLP